MARSCQVGYQARSKRIYGTRHIYRRLCYTFSLQIFQLREYEAERKEVNNVLAHHWEKLEAVYFQAPFKSYYEGHLRPWYLLCLAARERHKAILNSVQLANPQETGVSIKRIDSALTVLSEYNSTLQTILNARQFNTPFDELDDRKLKALIELLDFKPKEGEEAFKAGLNEAHNSAELLLIQRKLTSYRNLHLIYPRIWSAL
jgi:hypothetical protein